MSKLKLKKLAQDAQALRDVKHFVKDYQGHLALPLPHLSKPVHSDLLPLAPQCCVLGSGLTGLLRPLVISLMQIHT